MTAYCRRYGFGLGDGWLAYAVGDSTSGPIDEVKGPHIRRVALLVDAPWDQLLGDQ
ncbi:hypothetical protein GCM10017714_13300 [Curtobacterium pusillum]|nr:hypothetical protein GCM10017610_08760 [Curtobacterium pusillum]